MDPETRSKRLSANNMLPFMDESDQEALRRVRALLLEDTGREDVGLPRSCLPEELQDLWELVNQFGIGDDPLRGMAVNMMSDTFYYAAQEAIERKSEIIDAWANEGEFTGEKSVVIATVQAFYGQRVTHRGP